MISSSAEAEREVTSDSSSGETEAVTPNAKPRIYSNQPNEPNSVSSSTHVDHGDCGPVCPDASGRGTAARLCEGRCGLPAGAGIFGRNEGNHADAGRRYAAPQIRRAVSPR